MTLQCRLEGAEVIDRVDLYLELGDLFVELGLLALPGLVLLDLLVLWGERVLRWCSIFTPCFLTVSLISIFSRLRS